MTYNSCSLKICKICFQKDAESFDRAGVYLNHPFFFVSVKTNGFYGIIIFRKFMFVNKYPYIYVLLSICTISFLIGVMPNEC